MEVAGLIIPLNDLAVLSFLCYHAILIAKMALNKIKKRQARNVFRKR